MRKSWWFLGAAGSTSTLSTRARGGPTRAQSRTRFIFTSSPSRKASTDPSGLFLTHPLTPRSDDSCAMLARNDTPCTSPLILTLTAVAIAHTRAGKRPMSPVTMKETASAAISRAVILERAMVPFFPRALLTQSELDRMR